MIGSMIPLLLSGAAKVEPTVDHLAASLVDGQP